MITLESGRMSHFKKIVYSISKIPIPQNERKQTGPKGITDNNRIKVENYFYVERIHIRVLS